jgi:hypothetical protein
MYMCRRLILILADGYHHLVKQFQPTLHYIRMTYRERIKTSGKKYFPHIALL